MIVHTRRHEWPSREEWAAHQKTVYTDDVHQVVNNVSTTITDYATTEEIAAAVAELRTLWKSLAAAVRVANAAARAVLPSYSDSTTPIRQRVAAYLALSPADHDIVQIANTVADRRKNINEAIRELRDGWVPGDFTLHRAQLGDACPSLSAILDRRRKACVVARDTYITQVENRPVDDDAWRHELVRRAKVERYWREGPLITHVGAA